MGEVVRLKTKTDKVKDWFNETRDEITNDHEVECAVILAKDKKGQWIIGYYNCNFAEQAEAIAQLNCDLIDRMINANPDRYNL